MFSLRKVVPALCLAASLSGPAVYAATATPAPDTATTDGGHHWHGHHHGFMGMVLHKLNLTDAQKAQVKTIMAEHESQFEALRASSKANRQALETTPPTDAGYPALIATAQKNAATRIQLMSETWTSIHQNVLTQAQRDAIPGLVTAAQAQREERMQAWKSRQQGDAAAPTQN